MGYGEWCMVYGVWCMVYGLELGWGQGGDSPVGAPEHAARVRRRLQGLWLAIYISGCMVHD